MILDSIGTKQTVHKQTSIRREFFPSRHKSCVPDMGIVWHGNASQDEVSGWVWCFHGFASIGEAAEDAALPCPA